MANLTRVAPEIPVADMAEALEYYEAQLGFEVVMQMPAGDYAIVARDEVSLHLFEDRPRDLSPVSFHIFVDGLDELFSEFKSRGATVAQSIVLKPWGNRDFRIADPCGNELKFSEPLGDED